MKVWLIKELIEEHKEREDLWQKKYLNEPRSVDCLEGIQIWRMKYERHMSVSAICIITGKDRPDVIEILERVNEIRMNV